MRYPMTSATRNVAALAIPRGRTTVGRSRPATSPVPIAMQSPPTVRTSQSSCFGPVTRSNVLIETIGHVPSPTSAMPWPTAIIRRLRIGQDRPTGIGNVSSGIRRPTVAPMSISPP